MSDRSDGPNGHGTESPQKRPGNRNSGKRRRRRARRRQQPGEQKAAIVGDAVSMNGLAHADGNIEGSETTGDKAFVASKAFVTPSPSTELDGEAPGSGKPSGRKKHWRNRRGPKNRGSSSRHTASQEQDASVSRQPSNVSDTRNGAQDTKHNLEIPGRRNKAGRRRGYRETSAYAALDLGTNNCRLLVAVPRYWGRFRVVDGFSRIVRLGEGLSQTGELGDAAMDRAIEALKVCASKLDNRNLRQQRLIATEACRQAVNGDHFLARVRAETGLELEVVTRETEAKLAAEGCAALMDARSDAAVMFDIGGGSTELILVKGKKQARGGVSDRIAAWTSLPMGVVTLAERFGGKDVTRDVFARMVETVAEEIRKFQDRENLDASFVEGNAHLLGTSGTVTTLAGVHLGLDRYDRRKVDGLWLDTADIDRVIHKLLGMDYQKRADNPCIGTERADLVLAGCAIFEAIRHAWPTDRLRVADRGLREGLISQMMHADGVWRRGRRRRY